MKPIIVTPLTLILLSLITVEMQNDAHLDIPLANQNQLLFTSENARCISFRHVSCSNMEKAFTVTLDKQEEYYKPEELMESLNVREGFPCISYRYIPCQQNSETLSTTYENGEEYLLRAYKTLFFKFILQERQREEERSYALEVINQLKKEVESVQSNLNRCRNQANEQEMLRHAEQKFYGENNATFQLLTCNNESSLLKKEINILNANWTKNVEIQSQLLEFLEVEKQNHLSSNAKWEEKMQSCNNESFLVMEQCEILAKNLTALQSEQAGTLALLDDEKQRNILSNEKLLTCNNEIVRYKEENGILNANLIKSENEKKETQTFLAAEKENNLSSNKTFNEKLSKCNSRNFLIMEENEILENNSTNLQNENAKFLRLLETEKQNCFLLTKEFEEKLLVCGNETLLTIEENQVFRNDLAKCQDKLQETLASFQSEFEYYVATNEAEFRERLQSCNKRIAELDAEIKTLHSLIARMQSDQKLILGILEDEKERCRVSTDNLNQALLNSNRELGSISERNRVLSSNLTKSLNEQKEMLNMLQVERENHRLSNVTLDEKLLLCNNKLLSCNNGTSLP